MRVRADSVEETTLSHPGTGDIVLAGATAGNRPFSVIGDGNECYYRAETANLSAWEIGSATYDSFTNSLSRDVVYTNSLGTTSLVDLTGVCVVFLTLLSRDIDNAGPSAANPTATAKDTVVNGSALTFMRSDAAPAIQKASSSQFGLAKVDGTSITATSGVISATASAANPTATAGPTAVNGSASTYMRSDAAPAIQKASASQFGIVEVDGTSITAVAGVISATTGGGTPGGSNKAIQYNNSGVFGGIGPLTNGQLIIGSTGATSVAASLTAPAAGITITGGAGSITFALGNDLAALEAMSGTGLVARIAAESYAQRAVTGTSSRISVSNGNGVSGNPTLDIDSAYVGQTSITTLGTIGTGTWAGTTIAVNRGGTGQTSYTDGQLLIGNTSGNTLTKATLTAGGGISITNGNGSITVAATGGVSNVDVQSWVTSGAHTWTKPSGVTWARVICFGGGGSGGGGQGLAAGNRRDPGTGGGGGERRERTFAVTDLGTTETATVGAGGTGGTAGSTGNGGNGNAGGTTTFGSWVAAGGGGAGRGGQGANSSGGGGGGWGVGGANGSAGNVSGGGTATVAINGISQIGGGSGVTSGLPAEEGGGGGGGTNSGTTTGTGATSLGGGGGGGAGGVISSANSPVVGKAGGLTGGTAASGTANSFIGGGGAAGTGSAGNPGTGGSDGNSGNGGCGGGGGAPHTSGTGGVGGAGGTHGGGGGGGGGGTTVGGVGGDGGVGAVYVVCW